MILKPNSTGIRLACEALTAGACIGLPTETVYGLAADASNDVACEKIFHHKQRPINHPLIVHIAQAQVVRNFATNIPEFAQQLMQHFWPGPLTLILPRRTGVATVAAGGHASIGLRCPSHPVAQRILTQLLQQNSPISGLAAPSANRFGRVSPTCAAHVQNEFGENLLILDGGVCSVGIESTIVDCSRNEPIILRPGQISSATIMQALDRPSERTPTKGCAPAASGTLKSHYAPTTAKVFLLTPSELHAALLEKQAGISGKVAVYCRQNIVCTLPNVILRSMPASPHDVAHELFALLRQWDDQNVDQIWIEALPQGDAWDGVRDRVSRAATNV